MRTYKQNPPKLFLYSSSRGDFRGNFAFTSAKWDEGKAQNGVITDQEGRK